MNMSLALLIKAQNSANEQLELAMGWVCVEGNSIKGVVSGQFIYGTTQNIIKLNQRIYNWLTCLQPG